MIRDRHDPVTLDPRKLNILAYELRGIRRILLSDLARRPVL